MNRIRTIIDKEWAEVFKNRLVLFTVFFVPLMLTALPIAILYFTRSTTGSSEIVDAPGQFMQACVGMPAQDCLSIYLVNEFMILYMIMPVMIPITIAAYSIVGEKTTRSLEPLLATPITTSELLIGKSLASVIPAILATYGGFFLFAISLPLVGVSQAVQRYIFGPTWMIAIFVLGPLMAVLAVNFAIFISSRVNDPRVAEQASALLLLPVLVVLFGQIGGFIILNPQLMLISAAVLLLLDVGAIYMGVMLFQRENILTRWK
jgi:ABC-2 type transport system permease protein